MSSKSRKGGRGKSPRKKPRKRQRRAPAPPPEDVLSDLEELVGRLARGKPTRGRRRASPTPAFELSYHLTPPPADATRDECRLAVAAWPVGREGGREGSERPYQPRAGLPLAHELDQKIARFLPGGERAPMHRPHRDDPRGTYRLDAALAEKLVPLLARTGRCRLAGGDTLAWEGDAPWRPAARVERDPERDTCRVAAALVRGGDRVPLAPDTPILGGCLVRAEGAAPIAAGRAQAWARRARTFDERPLGEERELVAELAACSGFVDVRLEEARRAPHQPVLSLGAPDDDGRIPFTLLFEYAGTRIRAGDRGALVVDADGVPVARDPDGEAAARAELAALDDSYGVELDPLSRGGHGRLDEARLAALVNERSERGWWIEARERRLRAPRGRRVQVRSTRGGFDLAAEAEYEGGTVDLAAALAALRAGNRFVRLDDGSLGLLPEEWLGGWHSLDLATRAESDDGERLFFHASQVRLLEGWLRNVDALAEGAAAGAALDDLRARLDALGEPAAEDPPASFTGRLRDYQREALGWIRFLRELRVGGCLADDMGLGKTVQVLAHLDARRAEDPARTALVVAPRSVVHQWCSEAARFAPRLRVVEHGGAGRMERLDELRAADLVVTSYGTLRRDADALARERFDTVVLDEATAIKNESSQTARAARGLQAELRLALSGTPVENHLGELWSLCEFLNPGVLGSRAAFRRIFERRETGRETGRDGALAEVARAIGPFFLRRTKDAVLDELPPKSDETVLLDLTDDERSFYAGIAEALRSDLTLDVPGGKAPASVRVIQALLRLRQVACHPGLVDATRAAETSTKLDYIVSRLEQIAEEGHKALVFSQFTSFLGLVRARLEERGIEHVYLDGRTRKRAERVTRFQDDPTCTAFLISLKAGGHGLNLTAADFVFLLDPWWNPAVETQAVDRAHRMGRERPVVSYRVIARGTVEEKVLALQEEKRDLAEKVLSGSRAGLAGLSREMLELLIR